MKGRGAVGTRLLQAPRRGFCAAPSAGVELAINHLVAAAGHGWAAQAFPGVCVPDRTQRILPVLVVHACPARGTWRAVGVEVPTSEWWSLDGLGCFHVARPWEEFPCVRRVVLVVLVLVKAAVYLGVAEHLLTWCLCHALTKHLVCVA